MPEVERMDKTERGLTPKSGEVDKRSKWDALMDDERATRIDATRVSEATVGENYANSKEFQELAERYPNIFTIDDNQAVGELFQLYNNVWELFGDHKGTIRNIMQERRSENFDVIEHADLLTIACLANAFDIKGGLDFGYIENAEDTYAAGYYDPDEHKIYIRREKWELNRATRNMQHELNICENIVHELWHAFQFQVADERETERGEKYNINLRYYQEPKGIRRTRVPKFENPYEQQLVEREAYVVGLTFRRFCESVM